MRFIIDAQLPRKLADWLIAAGWDAKHTLDLPHGNKTSDQQILEVSKDEDRIVVTKDSDFVDEFLLRGRPDKSLLFQRAISAISHWSYCLYLQYPTL